MTKHITMLKKLIVVVVMFQMVVPQVALANLPVVDSANLANNVRKEVQDSILSSIGKLLVNSAMVGVVNVGQQFARDLADSMATWIVEGDWGKSPLSYTRSFGDYVEVAWKSAAGDAIQNISQDLGLGTALCRGSTLGTAGALAMGIGVGLLAPLAQNAADLAKSLGGLTNFSLNKGTNALVPLSAQKPKCDFDTIVASYKESAQELAPSAFLARFNNAFEAGATEMDTITVASMQNLTAQGVAMRNAQLERTASNSFKSVVSPVSRDISETSYIVQHEATMNSVKDQQARQDQIQTGMLASGAEGALGIFANTFFNSLVSKYLQKRKQNRGITEQDKNVNLANIFGSGRVGGANSVSVGLKTAVVSSSDNWDQLQRFATCPDEFPQVDNCVIDSKFETAIRQAQTGKALTVSEAVSKGLISPSLELVSPADTGRNEDKLCYKTALCYSNLVKLRKARVIPLGWEIAAAMVGGSGKVTLGDAISGFNNCAYDDNGTPKRDAEHPYCHLIDPNWILKLPESQCRALVYGPVPESSYTSQRKQECVDQPSCLQEDESGKCTGAYGYCLRERNSWSVNADDCPAQFAGCRIFSNKKYGQASLIESTLDTTTCNEKNSGCAGFYNEYLPNGAFDKQKTKIFLNAQAATCDAQYAGCTQVTDSNTGNDAFVKVPPPGLECKGGADDPAECEKYAHACTVDEVGCNSYAPVDGDPAIPGIATYASRAANGTVTSWNDECPAQCVGYATYYERPTQFEPIANPALAFIPKTATACSSAAAGCTQFTNIDTPEKGGGSTAYYSQVQRCARPADKPHASFYTWEGSDTTGYQLHQFDFVVDASSKPLYDSDNQTEITNWKAVCNADTFKNRFIDGKPNPDFDPDCREFIDKTGGASHFLLAHLLVSSPECLALRAENVNEENCKAARGNFAGGACQYFALPSGSTTCTEKAVGCHGYDGAASANVKNIFTENFATAAGWSAGALSSEGITVGDTVLKIANSSTAHDVTAVQGKVYRIVFWAKGQGGVSVALKQGGLGVGNTSFSATPLKLSIEWQRYEVASAPITWDGTTSLVFNNTDGVMYLDNIVLKEQSDTVYVVRNSWNTPAVCDPNISDNVAGPMLNCAEYKLFDGTKDTKVNLTGFTNLCRETSVGCKRFTNTYNSSEAGSKEVVTSKDDSGKPDETTIIPADEFVYLAPKPEMYCPSDKRGCSALGVDVVEYKNNEKIIDTETTYRIVDPDNFGNTACLKQEDRCETYSTSDGGSRYFKLPDAAHRCEFKEKVVDDKGLEKTGWFIEGTTLPCYESFIIGGDNYGIFRNSDAQFVAANKTTGAMTGTCDIQYDMCTQFVDHADVSKDYPNGRPYYYLRNNRLDVSSCNGKVSLKEGCVLLEDTSKSAENNFATLATYCKSDPTFSQYCAEALKGLQVVPEKDGIAVSPVSGKQKGVITPVLSCDKAQELGLFSATTCEKRAEILLKLLTGKEGEALKTLITASFPTPQAICKDKDMAFVVADATVGQRALCAYSDANTIVKVRRERTCAEWLGCKSTTNVWDPTTQKYVEKCMDFGVCDKYASANSGMVGSCANWVDTSKVSKRPEAFFPLSTDRYIQRNVGWYGMEYSGYALWNKFQVYRSGFFNVPDSTTDSGKATMLGVGFPSFGNVCDVKDSDGVSCTATQFVLPATTGGAKSQLEIEFPDVNFKGVCFSKSCWYPMSGFAKKPIAKEAVAQTFTASSCRGYPEADAPFSGNSVLNRTVLGQPLERAQSFKGVNLCEPYGAKDISFTWSDGGSNTGIKDLFWNSQEGPKLEDLAATISKADKMGSCDCSYNKVSFGDVGNTRYYGMQKDVLVPKGVCNGGWVVVGEPKSKISGTGEAVSKVGLACNSDFDCVDERVTSISTDWNKGGTPTGKKKIEYFPSGENGKCDIQKNIVKVFGWNGYCLERDIRTHINNSQSDFACLTWLPLDISLENYNQYPSAAFNPIKASAGAYYCAESRGTTQPNGKNKVEFDTKGEGYSIGRTSVGPIPVPALANINVEEIDYIEARVISSDVGIFKNGMYSEGQLVPDNFTVRVQDDGIPRFYTMPNFYQNHKDDFTCPSGYRIQNTGTDNGLYDLFGTSDSIGDGNDTKMLIPVSRDARCDNQLGCNDYFTGKGDHANVNQYFWCNNGKSDGTATLTDSYYNINNKNPAADSMSRPSVFLTGVTRKHDNADSSDFSQGISSNSTDPVNNSAIWYVRFDNHIFESGENEFGLSKFLSWDIASSKNVRQDIPAADCALTLVNGGKGSSNHNFNQLGYELRFKFDNSGKFKEIDHTLCGSQGNYTATGADGKTKIKVGTNFNWHITVYLRDRCEKVVRTMDKKNDVNDSKTAIAFTDRTWDGPPALQNYKTAEPGYVSMSVAPPAGPGQIANPKDVYVERGNTAAPFGSLVSATNPNIPLGVPWFVFKGTVTPSYFLLAPKDGNLQWGRAETLVGNGSSFGCAQGTCLPLGTNDAMYFGPTLNSGELKTYKDLEPSFGLLSQIFAKFYGLYKYNPNAPNNSVYEELVQSPPNKDDTSSGKNWFPTIAAFDPSNCTVPGSCAISYYNGFSVNGVYKPGDSVVGKGFVTAETRFYAWADRNHMPIRKIIVNWGDGSQKQNSGDGLFRNAKPVCSTSEAPPPVCVYGGDVNGVGGKPDWNRVCQSKADCTAPGDVPNKTGVCQTEMTPNPFLYPKGYNAKGERDPALRAWSFGNYGGNGTNDPGACYANFIQYIHAYTFDDTCGGKSQPLTADPGLIEQYHLNNKVGVGERFCVFKPKVQLVDNWGVCGGVDDPSKEKPVVMGYSGEDNCAVAKENAYIPYQGFIIVKE